MFALTVILLQAFVITFSKEYTKKFDRYIISCHSTDFECFKRQYRSLRDTFLLGNAELNIGQYEPYVFHYADDTCVKITGVEESELIGISMDSNNKEYSIVLDMPVQLQQIRNSSLNCSIPDRVFENVTHTSLLKKFSSNATVQVTYPYRLHRKKGQVHMVLEEENLDVILDIPDLSQYDRENEPEAKLFEWSEWAYETVQHVDVAQRCLAPYTNNLRMILERLPINRLMLLYPDEEYTNIRFTFTENMNE